MPFTQDQLVIFAARSGNLALLRKRIDAGGDPNMLDPVHGSALTAAIHAGHLEIVEWLCRNGADPNLELADAVGPLEVALRRPDPKIVFALICAGAVLKRKSRPFYAQRLESCLKQVVF